MSQHEQLTLPGAAGAMALKSLVLKGYVTDDGAVIVEVSRSCLCAGTHGQCWRARCGRCGAFLSKHDYSAADAEAGARDALARAPGVQFAHECRGSR